MLDKKPKTPKTAATTSSASDKGKSKTETITCTPSDIFSYLGVVEHILDESYGLASNLNAKNITCCLSYKFEIVMCLSFITTEKSNQYEPLRARTRKSHWF
ncbi:hypothetical protein N7493_003090 [Penicillium malachiteum]|uniref:Uncharacterized protein n=1 Tax=Penicillium malachiteum TaxID=1324776 RepID=A0AAD6MZ98_9EURO|nr:hypothetical protein N7493_003090 [Penicillium malachiteum]